MIKQQGFENLFEEQELSLEEALNMIRIDPEEVEGVSNVKDSLEYNSGWYNYSLLTFDYKEKRYSIEYKEHTSDNVCEFDFTTPLICIGEVEEMEKSVTVEEMKRSLEKQKMQYENEIEKLKQSQKKKEKVWDIIKESKLTSREMNFLNKVFSEEDQDRKRSEFELRVAKMFEELAKL